MNGELFNPVDVARDMHVRVASRIAILGGLPVASLLLSASNAYASVRHGIDLGFDGNSHYDPNNGSDPWPVPETGSDTSRDDQPELIQTDPPVQQPDHDYVEQERRTGENGETVAQASCGVATLVGAGVGLAYLARRTRPNR